MNAKSSLPGVAGVVGLSNDPLRGHVLTIDGQPAQRTKGGYLLPGVEGQQVRARMRGRFLSAHPVIRIDGHDYTTGAVTAPFLLVIAFLPLLFLFGGNVVGVLLGLLGVMFNLWIVRAPRTEAWKVTVVLVVFVVAVAFSTFWAFFQSWVMGFFGR